MHDPKKVLEICEKATPGPWIHQHEHHGESVLYNDSNVVCFPYNFIDAQFIALARTALPEFAQRVIDLEQQRREDMKLMEETLGAQKMALAAIEKYKSENTKLRAAARFVCDESDYERMRDAFLELVKKEGESHETAR